MKPPESSAIIPLLAVIDLIVGLTGVLFQYLSEYSSPP